MYLSRAQIQGILAVAYSLQGNKSNAASTARYRMSRVVVQRVYCEYSYARSEYVYSLKSFKEIEEQVKSSSKLVGGRPSLSDEVIAEIKCKRAEGMTVREISSLMGVSVGSVSKYMH